jgi:Uma2 family endonuclease
VVAQPHRTRMSVEDYLTLDRDSVDARYEYINGYAYMISGGTLNHSTVSINVTSLLRNRLRVSSCYVYNSDARVRISATRYVYPDATISCDERDRGTGDIIHFPRLIVEVLSPSTEAYDRGQKFIYYRTCPTILEYVLVDTQHQAIDVYRRASANLWTLHLFGPGDQVEFASINVSIPIAALHEGVILLEDSQDS